jgi:hypothetical protein
MAKANLASLQKSNLGFGWARGHFHTSLIIMPKIKTTRTKKAPEGFEEIEPVGMLYCFQCNPL